MGYRLSKITTRTGDQGTTGLPGGDRVAKNDPRIVAMGAVDELNSCVGVVIAHLQPGEVRECLAEVQHSLFDAGAEVSTLGQSRLAEEALAQLDDAIARFNAQLEPLREFILPGGCPAAAACHVARTVCRRAETHVVGLQSAESTKESFLVPYLNRLSDLLFILARVLNKESGTAEPLWHHVRRRTDQ